MSAPAADDISIVLVAAVAENGVIGANGGMPWRLRSDLRHFREVTINKPVIMGRKTYDSIGKPLKDRTNIVITRDAGRSAPGVIFVTSFEEALELARADAVRRGADEVAVIGGSDVFVRSMPIAHRLDITHVHARPEGDVFFPPIDPAAWREVSQRDHPAGPDDSASFTVKTYSRR